ncbi:unnamed protein product [Kuraishia capsulata CBS 1993]|uniref:Dihydrofolate synthetase n=1 Tax=Kuraishia capsulata CBS 1993 TaxID=1382522 RepID=W6MQC7_9ASCO|nr:uncharacterized protein KUCA_T00004940001 [Kuraishia capsulata CBS 1993]CDK28954.1 unnamed protein product [Kuraishia capsulata CBS 1993]
MPLDLQLHRMVRLLQVLGNPHLSSWKAVHVAGTNGKGSVCAYLSQILTLSKVKNGRFTSPHMLYVNDSICVNNKPVSLAFFETVQKRVIGANDKMQVGATEFEILTCTAFEIFKLAKVEVAVIEVGLGGRLDATNVIPAHKEGESFGVVATGITKIGLDHEGILGSTLAAIAGEKAGIIKPGVPCVVDGSNANEALEVFKRVADEQGVMLTVSNPKETTSFGEVKRFKIGLLGKYQHANLSVTLKLAQLLVDPRITQETVAEGISSVKWPGRLQTLRLPLLPDSVEILLDGAHNGSAADELAAFVDTNLRPEGDIVYVFAATKGKVLDPIMKPLFSNRDTVILTEFSPVDGMPWVSAYETADLKIQVQKYTDKVYESSNPIEAIKLAGQLKESNGSVVVCGSLYLAADILRLERKLLDVVPDEYTPNAGTE